MILSKRHILNTVRLTVRVVSGKSIGQESGLFGEMAAKSFARPQNLESHHSILPTFLFNFAVALIVIYSD